MDATRAWRLSVCERALQSWVSQERRASGCSASGCARRRRPPLGVRSSLLRFMKPFLYHTASFLIWIVAQQDHHSDLIAEHTFRGHDERGVSHHWAYKPAQQGALDPMAEASSMAFPGQHAPGTPTRPRTKQAVAEAFLQRLQERGDIDLSVPGLVTAICRHFETLPTRYALDVNIDSLDVLSHKRLLEEARSDPATVSFAVRPVEVLHARPRESSDGLPAPAFPAEVSAHAGMRHHGRPQQRGRATHESCEPRLRCTHTTRPHVRVVCRRLVPGGHSQR